VNTLQRSLLLCSVLWFGADAYIESTVGSGVRAVVDIVFTCMTILVLVIDFVVDKIRSQKKTTDERRLG
jgi:uncharacterized membrane protein